MRDDLISRQAVINLIEDLKKSPYANDPNDMAARRGTMELIQELCEHRLPTAYDVDKVVEQLEKLREAVPVNRLLDDIVKDKPKELGQLMAYRKAIEIVKSGGIG